MRVSMLVEQDKSSVYSGERVNCAVESGQLHHIVYG